MVSGFYLFADLFHLEIQIMISIVCSKCIASNQEQFSWFYESPQKLEQGGSLHVKLDRSFMLWYSWNWWSLACSRAVCFTCSHLPFGFSWFSFFLFFLFCFFFFFGYVSLCPFFTWTVSLNLCILNICHTMIISIHLPFLLIQPAA